MAESNENAAGPDWGINLESVQCPACSKSMPPIRVPKDWHELMWGGWTCPACGCQMDKWGKARDVDEA
jgi:hypothetical protein